jgi:hypothetical protein
VEGDDSLVPDVLLAPYLPLSHQARVGPWQLIPFKAMGESDAVPDDLRHSVSRLIDTYRLPSGAGSILGVVAFPHGAHVGAPFERSTMRTLGHALLAGVVVSNPSMAVSEDDQEPNAGFAIATAENALLYGHPLGVGDSYAVETGVLARVTSVRHAPGDEPLPKVEPPVELPRTLFGSFDEEFAHAAHEALATPEVAARRLRRALDWYRIALSNAEAISLEVRVGAARSALEVLISAGEETKRLVRAYGQLTREEDTRAAIHAEVFWAKGPVELTPDEWWMTALCALRNAIVHGDEVPIELWQHEGHHQLNHIHDRLIASLRIHVGIAAGDPLLRLPQRDRVFPRIHEKLVERMRHDHDDRPA